MKPKMDPKQKEKPTNNKKFSRGSNRHVKYEDKGPVKSKHNDPSWYLVNGQLAKDVANFSFNNAVGDKVHLTSLTMDGAGAVACPDCDLRFPGVFAIYSAPTIGVARDLETDPVNIAAQDIYSFVRHANSGHANYDPADLAIYLLAMDSVFTYWSYLTRIYGVTQTFSQRNRYIGDALLRAMGVNPSDIRSNLPQLRAYINQYAIKASVLAVPNTMTYYLRHSWMYQNVYMDENNPKAQLFMYVPAWLYKFEVQPNAAGGLTPVPVGLVVGNTSKQITGEKKNHTVTNLRAIGDEIIGASLQQEDVGIMSGDILKAYGSDKLWRFEQLPENYAIGPVYSEEVLLQMHNTNFTGGYTAVTDLSDGIKYVRNFYDAFSVRQSTGVSEGNLIWEPLFGYGQGACYSKILDTWKEDPTPEENLVATRNMIMMSVTDRNIVTSGGMDTGIRACRLQTCGSEICVFGTIWRFDNAGILTDTNIEDRLSSTNTSLDNLAYTTKFNQFPILYQYSIGSGITAINGELSNYTVLGMSQLYNLHNTAILSMLGVPYKW